MSFVSRRLTRALVLALVLGAIAPAVAVAASGTITQQDCNQGRIRDQSGNAIPLSRCEKLIGQSVKLASTGFDAWIVAVAGGACLVAAVGLRRPLRLRLRPARR